MGSHSKGAADVAAIKAVIDNLPDSGALSDLATILAAVDTEITTIDTVVDGIQTDLSNGTDGLGALKTLIDAVKGVVDAIPTTVMRGTDSAALASSWTAALATALGNYTAARAGYLDELAAANLPTDVAGVKTVVDAITAAGPTKAEMDTAHALLATPAQVTTAITNYDPPTRAEATADKDAVIAAIPAMVGTNNAATEAKQDIIDANVDSVLADTADMQPKLGTPAADISADIAAVKAVVDAITGAVTSDWKGNFNWDTSAYTTDETDISALFSTNLALVVRRKYIVKLDLTNVEADGSFTELYLAVKEKIDGTNYRAIDRKTITKAEIAAAAEPGIAIDIPATSENVQITMKMAVALAGDASILYSVVKEHLE